MRTLDDGLFDLIYLDPPFFTGRSFRCSRAESNGAGFEDAWAGDLARYLDWLQPRLEETRRLLKPTGSVFVHLDWHAVHYVKVRMDGIFGYRNFVNEIIWSYRTGGGSRRRFARKHDTILLYQVSPARKFNLITERSYQSHRYGYRNVPYFWDEKAGRQYRYAYPRDVWELTMGTQTSERTGYPTQKPEGLLERIILSSTDVDDLVGDFFCGSGTTLVAAQRLGRRFIGCDSSPEAVRLSLERLAKMPSEPPRRDFW